MHNTQADLQNAARAHAADRANREGLPMTIWADSAGRWYVRSQEEGAPDAHGSRTVETVNPEGGAR